MNCWNTSQFFDEKLRTKMIYFVLLSSPTSLQRWSIIATMHSPTHQVYTVEIDSAIALNCTAHFETSSSIEVEITPICPNMIHDNIEISSNEKNNLGKVSSDMYETCEDGETSETSESRDAGWHNLLPPTHAPSTPWRRPRGQPDCPQKVLGQSQLGRARRLARLSLLRLRLSSVVVDFKICRWLLNIDGTNIEWGQKYEIFDLWPFLTGGRSSIWGKTHESCVDCSKPWRPATFFLYIFVQLHFLCTLLFAPLAILLEFLVTRVSNGCGEV